jgi:hypothetical protein
MSRVVTFGIKVPKWEQFNSVFERNIVDITGILQGFLISHDRDPAGLYT